MTQPTDPTDNYWRETPSRARRSSAQTASDQIPIDAWIESEFTPEIEFERCWARELMDRALAEVKKVYEEGGKSDVFASLSGQLGTTGASKSYEEIGVELGVSEGAVRFRAYKLRQRFRAALRELVEETVATAEEADEEIAYLLQVFEAPAA